MHDVVPNAVSAAVNTDITTCIIVFHVSFFMMYFFWLIKLLAL